MTWVTATLVSLILVHGEPHYRDVALLLSGCWEALALAEDARTFLTRSLAISQSRPPSLLQGQFWWGCSLGAT